MLELLKILLMSKEKQKWMNIFKPIILKFKTLGSVVLLALLLVMATFM